MGADTVLYQCGRDQKGPHLLLSGADARAKEEAGNMVIHGKIFGLPVETFSTAGPFYEILYNFLSITLPKSSAPSLCTESIHFN